MYVGRANLILSIPLSGNFCHHAVVVDVARCMARGFRAQAEVLASPRCVSASASTRVIKLEHEHEHEHEHEDKHKHEHEHAARVKETTGRKALVASTLSRILCTTALGSPSIFSFHLIFPNISSLDPPRSTSTIALFSSTSIL